MAQYDNLKDYFHGEHLELITNAVKDYLKHDEKSDCQVSAPCIKSLVCTNDDAMFNVEYEVGISADIVLDNETCSRSFIITITGNLEQRLDDIKVVSVKNISENDFPADNLLRQYILPDLPESEVERIGSEIILAYQKRGVFDDCQLSLERLIQKEPIFFSPLPDNCLGRIILTDDDVEIFYKDDTEQIKCKKYHATPGTILLNKKKYFDAIDGSLMITIAHELAHWWFHQRFFKVLLLLGEESVDLISSTDTATTNDSTTDILKALSIAEVQADELAVRLAIPQSTVEATIKKIANDPSTHYENFGDRMQACVNKFAGLYSVSPFVAKERLRQLGYDFVDGTCLEYEENGSVKRPAPFYFQPGKLEENETFVIYPEDYERLLRENKSFAELINTGKYVYLGFVVCVVYHKFINVIINETGLHFRLTTYAREHADECCIKFAVKKVYNKGGRYKNYVHTCLYKTDEGLLKQYEALIPDNIKKSIDAFAKEDSRLNKSLPYGDALAYYMFEYNRSVPIQVKRENGAFTHQAEKIIEENAETFNLSKTILKKYINNEAVPKRETAMSICYQLGLNETQSRRLIENAGYSIESNLPENILFKLVFNLPAKDADTVMANWNLCVEHLKK